MPRVLAERFQSLISVMEEMVEQATEPVRERLRAWSKQQSPEDISRWELPELVHAVDTDFTVRRKRSLSPRYTKLLAPGAHASVLQFGRGLLKEAALAAVTISYSRLRPSACAGRGGWGAFKGAPCTKKGT